MRSACSVRVRGVVQGVGFRPFVFRLAHDHDLAGWVLNGGEGVEIHIEGTPERLQAFVRALRPHAPPAATIAAIDVEPASDAGMRDFSIRESRQDEALTTRISPDLAVCDQCVSEMFDPRNVRYAYPFINCTDCGPRYSIILDLPYDRVGTTMTLWLMDAFCAREYQDPRSRRFHAQPVACGACGPRYVLHHGEEIVRESERVVHHAAQLLREGKILAVKGIGGFHLACDARNAATVRTLRERKYRKEKPFAVMPKDLETARRFASISEESEALLLSTARPIVLVPATVELPEVAPENDALGVVMPYAPIHHLLFAAQAPAVLVMTSANRSSEPIAYEDDEAVEKLSGIADAFLIGERPIARRVEDSIARAGPLGPAILRRSRGYAPGSVAALPTRRRILAVGADLKNAITLVVDGQAFVSQFIGDLEHFEALQAFRETIRDLLHMYAVRIEDLVVVRDQHPQYFSTAEVEALGAVDVLAVQHHRAHVASVLAERGAWRPRVLGIALDGTGYGDDGTIWGGEFFAGSMEQGFERVAHLRQALLPGGDAAARHPVQAAAGFLHQLDGGPDFTAPPFNFPVRYREALQLVEHGTRTFTTTSAGRLFDTAAALLGFTRPVTFEGQAAIWLEQLARRSAAVEPYACPFVSAQLDFRPLLGAIIDDRRRGRRLDEIARAFHAGFANGLRDASVALAAAHRLDAIAVSGGVFQNDLLLAELKARLDEAGLELWTNHAVPPNDGGISLGQAALAAFSASLPTASKRASGDAPEAPVPSGGPGAASWTKDHRKGARDA